MYAAMLALAARLQQDAAGPTITADVTELDTHAQVRFATIARLAHRIQPQLRVPGWAVPGASSVIAPLLPDIKHEANQLSCSCSSQLAWSPRRPHDTAA